MDKGLSMHRPPSLAQQAFRMLKEDILTATFKPGELLVERDLARHYGVGKTPMREALHALQKEGLVDAIPRAGYIVSAITTRDVQELFQLRLILETSAAELAARNTSEQDLQRLRELAGFDYTYGDRASYEAFLNSNTNFHYMVARSSGNQRLAQIVLRLLEDLERLFHLELDIRDSAAEMVNEHIALVAALTNRDPEKARQVMAEQIVKSRDRVLEAIAGPKIGPGD